MSKKASEPNWNVSLPADERAAPRAGQKDKLADLHIERRWFLKSRVDLERFNYFYEKYHGPIQAFILHRTGDPDLAEELASETFLRALRGLWKFRWQGVTFGAWLYRIAVNVVNRHYRQESRMRSHHQPGRLASLPDPGAGPHDRLENAEARRRLRSAMATLDPDTQTILALKYFEGLKIREIALITRMPEGTIKARISRALGKLRTKLTEPKSSVNHG